MIEGTRVLVATVLGALAGGDSKKRVAEDYDISLDQISDTLRFASEMANMQVSSYDAVA